jgi:hypothetical protein
MTTTQYRYVGPRTWNGSLENGEVVEVIGGAWRSGGHLVTHVITARGERETVLIVQLESM